MYSKEGLQNGIVNCQRNIDGLEHAIAREKATIAEYRHMIREIDKAEKLKAEAESHVEVVYENGDTE